MFPHFASYSTCVAQGSVHVNVTTPARGYLYLYIGKFHVVKSLWSGIPIKFLMEDVWERD